MCFQQSPCRTETETTTIGTRTLTGGTIIIETLVIEEEAAAPPGTDTTETITIRDGTMTRTGGATGTVTRPPPMTPSTRVVASAIVVTSSGNGTKSTRAGPGVERTTGGTEMMRTAVVTTDRKVDERQPPGATTPRTVTIPRPGTTTTRRGRRNTMSPEGRLRTPPREREPNARRICPR